MVWYSNGWSKAMSYVLDPQLEHPYLRDWGLIPMLNKRLFIIKRLKNCLNEFNVKQVAESIYVHNIIFYAAIIIKVFILKITANKTTITT